MLGFDSFLRLLVSSYLIPAFTKTYFPIEDNKQPKPSNQKGLSKFWRHIPTIFLANYEYFDRKAEGI